MLQPEPILQSHLPIAAWMDARTARLPGILPVEGDAWLSADDAFAAQMALRDQLISDRPSDVIALLPEARAAAEELYALTLTRLTGQPGYDVGLDGVRRPDGVLVQLDRPSRWKRWGGWCKRTFA